MSSKTGSASKIKMESFDDLFGGSNLHEVGAEQIINAPLADLYAVSYTHLTLPTICSV